MVQTQVADGGDGHQISRIAANIMNKQSHTAANTQNKRSNKGKKMHGKSGSKKQQRRKSQMEKIEQCS
jgi:hypothetical protein